MIYEFNIAVAANTTEASKTKTILTLHPGKITRVQVRFEDGAANLAHVQICRALNQVYPRNPDSDFNANNETISFDDDKFLADLPYELEAYTWNDDDTFPHTVTVRFSILETVRFID